MNLLTNWVKKILLLKVKKNLKIEKDLRIFHLKSLKKINIKKLNLFNNSKPISHFTRSIFEI